MGWRRSRLFVYSFAAPSRPFGVIWIVVLIIVVFLWRLLLPLKQLFHFVIPKLLIVFHLPKKRVQNYSKGKASVRKRATKSQRSECLMNSKFGHDDKVVMARSTSFLFYAAIWMAFPTRLSSTSNLWHATRSPNHPTRDAPNKIICAE